jgi:hypothetical protein
MALQQSTVYGARMSRLMCLLIATVLSLLSVAAPAAPVHKRPAPRWHGYGFLPGYQQPLNNALPLYAQKNGIRRWARSERRPWYIDPLLRVGWLHALFRPARLLWRPLQWRQLRPVLDADTDRAGLELRLIEPPCVLELVLSGDEPLIWSESP